jgi:hypothetical protein
LNIRINFGKSSFFCRVCDINRQNILADYNLKSNESQEMEIELNSINKNNYKFYYTKSKSKIFNLKKIDYLKTFCLDVQHIEAEGELQRSIIILFLNIPNFMVSVNYKKMMIFLKFLQIDLKNIDYFFKNINSLDYRIYSIGNSENEDIKLNSGECLILFEIIPFFFKDFFENLIEKFFIRNFILHFRINNLIMKKEISNDDILLLEFLVKNRLKILVENRIKIMPKSALEIHFGEYIRWLGPIRFFSTFKFENHHSQLKKEVEIKSKNLAITFFFIFF